MVGTKLEQRRQETDAWRKSALVADLLALCDPVSEGGVFNFSLLPDQAGTLFVAIDSAPDWLLDFDFDNGAVCRDVVAVARTLDGVAYGGYIATPQRESFTFGVDTFIVPNEYVPLLTPFHPDEVDDLGDGTTLLWFD